MVSQKQVFKDKNKFCSFVKALNINFSLHPITMRFLFTLIIPFLLGVSTSKAGDTWGAGVTFSPNLSFVSFKGGDELIVSVNKASFRSFAQSALINGTFFIEKKYFKGMFAVGGGMGYRQLSEQTKASFSGGLEKVSKYVHEYATLPLYMRIYVTKKWYLKTGLTSLVNLDNSLTEIAESVSSGKTSSIKIDDENAYSIFNFSTDWGIGYTFLNRKIKMDLEPVYTYNLMGLLKGDVDANFYQSTFGLAMSIRM